MIAANFMAPTSYQPLTWNGPNLSPVDKYKVGQSIKRAIELRSEFINKIALRVKSLEVVDIRSNKTGNKVDMKIRYNGRSCTLHLCTVEGNALSKRTTNSMAEEMIRQMVEYLDASGSRASRWENELLNVIRNEVNKELKEKLSSGHLAITKHEVEMEIIRTILAMDVAEGTNKVFDAYENFMLTDGVLKTRNAHQTRRALNAVRTAAAHAFQHGCDIEEIITAVRETLVGNVLGS